MAGPQKPLQTGATGFCWDDHDAGGPWNLLMNVLGGSLVALWKTYEICSLGDGRTVALLI